MCRYHECRILAWVDSNYNQYQSEYMEITNPDYIYSTDFDYIIVAVDSLIVADSIIQPLVKNGIQKDRILWERPAVFGEVI